MQEEKLARTKELDELLDLGLSALIIKRRGRLCSDHEYDAALMKS